MKAHIVTANRLRDGEVVYLTASGAWSEAFEEAHRTTDKADAEALLQSVETAAEELRVVGPYVADIEFEDGVAAALSQRELIRAHGPTVHKHFGKQARGDKGNAASKGNTHV